MNNNVYWLREKLITGSITKPSSKKDMTIIGSGLTAVSCAYWLIKNGFDSIQIIDDEPQKAASFRNCGHILTGTVESMAALVALHGEKKAKEIWAFSHTITKQVEDTITQENFECDYKKDGYLVVAIDETENLEIKNSIELLKDMGFESSYKDQQELEALGLKNTYGARFDPSCAHAHPVKFRNEVLNYVLARGVTYISGHHVKDLISHPSGVSVKMNETEFDTECVILATNAYSLPFFKAYDKKEPMVPFKGQIICSSPLKEPLKITCPHSFDHGYEYALQTTDKRLMLGGWRKYVKGQEEGKTDLSVSKETEQGLKSFAQKYYRIKDAITWDYSWSGVMASSHTALPMIGPLDARVFACLGYTGHGFSWAHGSSKLLCDMILGKPYDKIARFFRP